MEKSIVQNRLLELVKYVYDYDDPKICKHCLMLEILHIFEDLELNEPLIKKLETAICTTDKYSLEDIFDKYQIS